MSFLNSGLSLGRLASYTPALRCGRCSSSPKFVRASPSIYHRPTPINHQRCISFTTTSTARQVLGRITPKRIAVPINRVTDHETHYPKASIWRPIIFCIAFGGGGYILLAEWQNSDTAKWMAKVRGRFRTHVADKELQRAKILDSAKHTQERLKSLPQTLSFLPSVIVTPILRIYVTIGEWWFNTPDAKVGPVEIIGVMGLVFVGWRFSRLERFMGRWFMHRPVTFGTTTSATKWRECVTLFTSTISHQSLAHFAFNSIALYSFGQATFALVASPAPGTPQLSSSTYTPPFLAFLLTAGLFSSLSSHLYTNLVKLPKLLRALRHPARLSSAQALAVNYGILPGLGASGAIYAALTLTACGFPASGVTLIFLPFFSIPIGWGVAGLVAVDIAGLIRGWRMFDHVAHLSGAFYGLVYYQYGRQVWTWTRVQLAKLQQRFQQATKA